MPFVTMNGLDTNILVRFILQDEPEQARVATHFIENHCTPEEPGYINSIVICELIWVLGKGYRYDKRLLIKVLRQLLASPELVIEQRENTLAALRDYQESNADFSDHLLARINQDQGCITTYTFDRKAARSSAFTQLINQSHSG